MKRLNDRNNLLIVDGLNLAFRWKHNGTKNYSPKFMETVSSLATSYNAKLVIVLGDAGSSYRKSIFEAYKANRAELRANQTPEEEQEFREFLEEFEKIKELIEYQSNTLFFRFKGLEADDIAAYLSAKFGPLFNHTWLISSDKDWDLLVNEKTSRFSYRTRKEITLENWNEHYLHSQEDHISIKVLMGDKGDNVPGVEGIGEKRAYNLVREYGSAFDIYDQIPLDSNYVYIKNLNQFKDQILLNYKLMDLPTYCEDIVGQDNINIIDKVVKEVLDDY